MERETLLNSLKTRKVITLTRIAEPGERSARQQERGQRLLERHDVLERRVVVVTLYESSGTCCSVEFSTHAVSRNHLVHDAALPCANGGPCSVAEL